MIEEGIRGKWRWLNGEFVPIAEIREVKPTVYIQTDTIDPIEHPLDGKMYDSKSAVRAVTKAHGYMEIGNEKLSRTNPVAKYDRDLVIEAIRAAEEMLSQPDRRKEILGEWDHKIERAKELGVLDDGGGKKRFSARSGAKGIRYG